MGNPVCTWMRRKLQIAVCVIAGCLLAVLLAVLLLVAFIVVLEHKAGRGPGYEQHCPSDWPREDCPS